MLGFALQEPARAAQVPALLTSSRSFSASSSRWRDMLASTQTKGRGERGFLACLRRQAALGITHLASVERFARIAAEKGRPTP